MKKTVDLFVIGAVLPALILSQPGFAAAVSLPSAVVAQASPETQAEEDLKRKKPPVPAAKPPAPAPAPVKLPPPPAPVQVKPPPAPAPVQVKPPPAPAAPKPAAPAPVKPAPIIERPAPPVTVKPKLPAEAPAPKVERPKAPVIEKPAAPALEKPAAPIIEKPAAPIIEKPKIPLDAGAPAAGKPAPATGKAATPAIEKQNAPALDKPAAPILEKPNAPAKPPANLPPGTPPELTPAQLEDIKRAQELKRGKPAGTPPAAGTPAPVAPPLPAAGSPAAATPAAGTPAAKPVVPGTPPAPGTPAPGIPAPGIPAPGTPAPGIPAPGTPAPATPGAKPPAALTPPAPGTPAPGTPAAGTPAAPGAPGAKPPVAGTPPAPGTAVPGTPAPGAPAPATAAPGAVVPGAQAPVPAQPAANPAAPVAAPGKPKRRITPLEAAGAGLAAGLIGGYLLSTVTQGQPQPVYDDIRRSRQETDLDGVTIYREPGRTIIREDDRIFIRHDENERFRDLGGVLRSERRGGNIVTFYDRPDGTQIVTVTDDTGQLLKRSRRFRDGREFVLIDNTYEGPRRSYDEEIVYLPPPPIQLPRERYIVEAEQSDERVVYEALTAPPVAKLPRRYTLDEVRSSPDLRAHMRSVDVNSITFDSGSFAVSPDQASKLSVIAAPLLRAIKAQPNEVFLIEGHTDAVGSDVDNLSLSDRRAQSVAAILSKDYGVPPENLTTQGYGKQYLKEQTQEASRVNRRVTVRRITPLITGQGAGQEPAPAQ